MRRLTRCCCGEERRGAALCEIERAARHDAEQQCCRCGEQDREAKRYGHARHSEDGGAFRGLAVEREQQAQIVEGGDAAVYQANDGEPNMPCCSAAEKT